MKNNNSIQAFFTSGFISSLPDITFIPNGDGQYVITYSEVNVSHPSVSTSVVLKFFTFIESLKIFRFSVFISMFLFLFNCKFYLGSAWFYL